MGILETIRSRSGLRASLSNIGWLSGDRILRMFGGVVVSTAVARYLGPSRFGLLNYGLAIYGLFNILSNLGLDYLVVREVALDEKREADILGTAFVLKGLASLVTTAAAIVAARLLEPRDKTLLIIVALMSFAAISQAFDVVDYFFQAQTKSRYTVIARNTAFIAASIARLAAVFLHGSLLAFAWIAALEVLCGEIGLAIVYLKFRRPLPRWQWRLSQARALLEESWPLLVSSLMVMLYMRSDQILLGKLASTVVVGQYTAAIRLSEIWYAIPIVISVSVMPRILKGREQNEQQYYSRLQKLYESMVLLSVVVAICTQFAGPLVVHLLYGHQYAAASGILSIHIWTGIFVFVGCVSGQQFIQEKLSISSMQRTVLGAIVNIALNLLWIPRWGGEGSAMATLVAQGIASYFADVLDARTRHIFRMKTRAYLHFWKLPFAVWQGTVQ
ncbi:MAG TPA: flippase [Terracidiphilus sp.]|nr:flippase [Terracidiphilus sp.]